MRRLSGIDGVMRASLLALSACAAVAYVALVLTVIGTEWPVRDWPSMFFFPAALVVAGLMLGAILIAVFIAPAYLVLAHHRRATYLTSAIMGSLPGVALVAYEADLGLPAMLTGAVVAFATHWRCSRVGPNNSSKPTPLRGAA
jgi:hypothetical protein